MGRFPEVVMRLSLDRLPNRFPVGTRFVIEGRVGRLKQYLVFPDGREVDLPPPSRRARAAHPAPRPHLRRTTKAARKAGEKA